MLCVNHKKFKTPITRGKTIENIEHVHVQKKLRILLNIFNSSVIPSKKAAGKICGISVCMPLNK